MNEIAKAPSDDMCRGTSETKRQDANKKIEPAEFEHRSHDSHCPLLDVTSEKLTKRTETRQRHQRWEFPRENITNVCPLPNFHEINENRMAYGRLISRVLPWSLLPSCLVKGALVQIQLTWNGKKSGPREQNKKRVKSFAEWLQQRVTRRCAKLSRSESTFMTLYTCLTFCVIWKPRFDQSPRSSNTEHKGCGKSWNCAF